MKFTHLIIASFLFSCSSPLFKEIEQLKSERHFSAIHVLDLESNKVILSENANKYFTPASTTKLFTYSVAKKVLGDSITAFRYKIIGDSLILWGTGNPTLLHPVFQDSSLVNFIDRHDGKIYFSESNSKIEKLGSGWAWDDAHYSYSAELSPLPLFGNLIHVYTDSASQSFSVYPNSFTKLFARDLDKTSRKFRVRYNKKLKQYNYSFTKLKNDTFAIPYATTNNWQILGKISGKEILKCDYSNLNGSKEFRIKMPENLYAKMLKPSDNFLAEQLMIQVSDQLFDSLDISRSIRFALDSLYPQLEIKPRFVDGSGLSRYNLATAQNFVKILRELFQTAQFDEHRMNLAINGQAGTLERRHADMPPFLFAKTGTLSNNHNLVGLIKTKAGRWLAFAIMQNHYRKPYSEIKANMDSVVKELYLWQK